MAKKLQVKTPVTRDGVNLKYDKDKQVVYKTSIVERAARKGLESINSKLPEQLRSEFTEIEVEDTPKGSTTLELEARLNKLETDKKNSELEKRIAELENELAGKNDKANTDTVAVLVEKIKLATTKEEVETLAKDDERKGVKDAATKRLTEI